MNATGFSLMMFIALLSFSSCMNDPCSEIKEEKTVRTILAYIGRDNDLNGSFENKRDALIEGWDGTGGNLVIYQDLPEGAKLEVVYNEKNENKSRIIYEKAEENSADATVFSRVITEAVAECPADSYALIVFSHGSGWLPDASLSAPRSIILDKGNWMNLPDFANAIPDRLFDFIVLEACYMGGIEVAYELKDKAHYILASPAEILSPGFKEVYTSSINKLFLPEADLESFTLDLYELLSQNILKSVTLSLIRTSALESLANWVQQHIEQTSYPITEGIQSFDRNSRHLFFDFEQHFSRFTKNSEAKNELSVLIENCIVSKHYTPSFLILYSGFIIEHYSGFTTYIKQEQLPYLNTEYKKTKWAKAITGGSNY